MHTDCGMRGLDAQELRRELEAETGVRPDWEDVPMHTPEDDARTAVERIRSSPFLDHEGAVHGLVYAVATGRLRVVA